MSDRMSNHGNRQTESRYFKTRTSNKKMTLACFSVVAASSCNCIILVLGVLGVLSADFLVRAKKSERAIDE